MYMLARKRFKRPLSETIMQLAAIKAENKHATNANPKMANYRGPTSNIIHFLQHP